MQAYDSDGKCFWVPENTICVVVEPFGILKKGERVLVTTLIGTSASIGGYLVPANRLRILV